MNRRQTIKNERRFRRPFCLIPLDLYPQLRDLLA